MHFDQQPPRAWKRQPSGLRIDLLNPQPDAWTDEDMATGMSRVPRWAGHSKWPRAYSVAQHSLLVLALRQMKSPVPLTRECALQELVHDCDEGLLGFDCITPLKPVLGDGFKALCDGLTRVIFERYDVPWWAPEEHKAHKQADHLAAASEAIHVAGWAREEVSSVLGIQMTPVDHDPLADIYGGTPWEPWPADLAAERFLAALQYLASKEPGAPIFYGQVPLTEARQLLDDIAIQVAAISEIGR